MGDALQRHLAAIAIDPPPILSMNNYKQVRT